MTYDKIKNQINERVDRVKRALGLNRCVQIQLSDDGRCTTFLIMEDDCSYPQRVTISTSDASVELVERSFPKDEDYVRIKELKYRVTQALDAGCCLSIEFRGDGEMVMFKIQERNYRGYRTTTSINISLDNALPLLRGYRFAQHELKKCF